MIKHLRIDNRLIHGQIAAAWQKYVNAKAIIVCNDKVANDRIQKMALGLAAKDSKVLVFSVQDTIQYVKDNPNESLFVIAKFPQDGLDILESGVEVGEVNVGNAAPIVGTKYVMVTKSIAVTADDAAIYRKIAALRGGTLISQMFPTYEKTDFLTALKRAGL